MLSLQKCFIKHVWGAVVRAHLLELFVFLKLTGM